MDPASPFAAGASALSSMSSTMYYSHKSGCFVGFKRGARKKFMKNIKCFVISDIYRNKLTKDIFSVDLKTKLLNLEKIFEITFPNETIKSIRKIRITDYDTYICLVIKLLRQLLERYRYNNLVRTDLFIFVSSVKMAKKLGCKSKNITVFTPSEKLNDVFLKKFPDDVVHYHSTLDLTNEKGNKKIIKYNFESYDGLIDMILKLIPNTRKHSKETKEHSKEYNKKLNKMILESIKDDEIEVDVEEKGEDVE